MARGGKRDGAGRKVTGLPTKTIVKRLTIEEVDRLNNYDKLITELQEKSSTIRKITDFKAYKVKGELMIKVADLVEAKLLID